MNEISLKIEWNFHKNWMKFSKQFSEVPLRINRNWKFSQQLPEIFLKYMVHQSTLTHLNCFLRGNTDIYSISFTGFWKPLSDDFVTNSWLVTMAMYSAEHRALIVESYVKQWEFSIWYYWSHTLGLCGNACSTF